MYQRSVTPVLTIKGDLYHTDCYMYNHPLLLLTFSPLPGDTGIRTLCLSPPRCHSIAGLLSQPFSDLDLHTCGDVINKLNNKLLPRICASKSTARGWARATVMSSTYLVSADPGRSDNPSANRFQCIPARAWVWDRDYMVSRLLYVGIFVADIHTQTFYWEKKKKHLGTRLRWTNGTPKFLAHFSHESIYEEVSL